MNRYLIFCALLLATSFAETRGADATVHIWPCPAHYRKLDGPAGPRINVGQFETYYRLKKGDLISFRWGASNQLFAGQYLGMGSGPQAIRLRNTDGTETHLKVNDVHKVRQGLSLPLLHDFDREDLVQITSVDGKSWTGHVLGYTANGEFLFQREGENVVRPLPNHRLQSAKLAKRLVALHEREIRALPPPSSSRVQANPDLPSGQNNRPHEFPYRLPKEAIEADSKHPLKSDQLATNTVYLYVVREDGALVIAPDRGSGFDRDVKHRDLVPNSDGTQGKAARMGGEFIVVKAPGGQLQFRFNRDSSYMFNRTDGTSLLVSNPVPGADATSKALDLVFEKTLPSGLGRREIPGWERLIP